MYCITQNTTHHPRVVLPDHPPKKPPHQREQHPFRSDINRRLDLPLKDADAFLRVGAAGEEYGAG